ncbi:MAG: tyrosine-protein phosphatase [Syntrophobacteraceae bacterium]
MIDTHSHILPGLDDGSQDMEQALAMARIAVEDGIEAVICTPHWIRGLFENTRAPVLDAVQDFRLDLNRHGIPLIIYPGAELRIDFDMPKKIRERELLTLNDDGRYALIELPAEFVPPGIEEFFYLLQVEGVSPIVAHPERNPALLKDPTRLYRWIESGALTQITSMSLLGKFGGDIRNLCMLMLEHGMVHFMATDAHGLKNRAPKLSSAKKQAELITGKTGADRITRENPLALLRGDNPVTFDLIPLKRGFAFPLARFFSFCGWSK